MPEYTLIKSKRKTISVEIKNGGVIVRAPNRMTKREADAFAEKHADWINRHLAQAQSEQRRLETVEKLTREQLRALILQAQLYLPARVRHYAGLLGVRYGKITVRCQRTRWGSCSAKKNLNFNCLLMLTPPEVIDSVVAHEVCHLIEMNHSGDFYALVLKIFPEYHRWNRWLKDNGKVLLAKIPED